MGKPGAAGIGALPKKTARPFGLALCIAEKSTSGKVRNRFASGSGFPGVCFFGGPLQEVSVIDGQSHIFLPD